MDCRCLVPSMTQLVGYSIGSVESWLLGFGGYGLKKRKIAWSSPRLHFIRPWLWSWFISGIYPRDWIRAKEHFPAPVSKLDSVLGVTVQLRSDTMLELGLVVHHPRSLFFPYWWARGNQCHTSHRAPTLLRKNMRSYSLAGGKNGK